MTLELVTTLMQDMMMTTLIVSAPMLIAALVIGLLISVFQAATQINEQTLSFVPKIVVVFGVFGVLFPWMMQLMMEFNGRVMQVVAGTGGP